MANVRCISIRSDLDIVAARVEGRNLAKDIGFDIIDQARIATAITELARNVVLYAGDGAVTVRRIPPADAGGGIATHADVLRGASEEVSDQVSGGDRGIEIVCEDQGPGIQAVEAAVGDDRSVGRGLGTGLSATRRLMDEFDIRSEVGVGTVVTVRKWLR
jgi:serine/threonine-protein kinase RsbT